MDIVGIDVSKSELHVALLQGEGIVLHKKTNNSPKGFDQLAAWLKNRKAQRVHVCLEATGVYGDAVAEYLYDAGHTVSIVNPVQIKSYGRSAMVRTKTDKVDALLIAQFCRAHNPPAWVPPPVEIREFRALLRRREALTEMLVAERNRLEAANSEQIRCSIGDHVKFLEEQLARLDDDMSSHLRAHPEIAETVNRLDEIPGFGQLTAMKVLAETNAFSVCRTAKELVAYAGLNPRRYQSGKTDRRAGISKVGNAALRKALYLAALSAKNRSRYFYKFVQRLKAAGKPPKVIITAVMRKLLVLAHALVTRQAHFSLDYAP